MKLIKGNKLIIYNDHFLMNGKPVFINRYMYGIHIYISEELSNLLLPLKQYFNKKNIEFSENINTNYYSIFISDKYLEFI